MLGSLKRNIFFNTFIPSGSEESSFPNAYAGNMAWGLVCAVRQLRQNDNLHLAGNKIGRTVTKLSDDKMKRSTLSRSESDESDAAEPAGNPAGRAIGMADNTPLTSYCESLEPFLHMLKIRHLFFTVPFSILYALAFICEWLSFLLKPFYTLRLPLSKVAVDHMNCLPVFDMSDAQLFLKYEPIYSYKESCQRTFKYVEQNMK